MSSRHRPRDVGSVPDQSPRPSTAHRSALITGWVAPVVFVLTFSIHGGLTPGYDPWSMFVSELSLTAAGWVQRLNFVITGTLILVFAWAGAPQLRGRRRIAAATVTLVVLGACLGLSAFADTDPSTMSRPVTTHGLVHGLLGAVFFIGMPLSCFLIRGRLATLRASARMRHWTTVVGVLLVVGIVALKIAELPGSAGFPWKGLVQRVELVLFLGWLASFAIFLRRATVLTAPSSGR